MDYGILNGLGITALAIFGLWAFFRGEKMAIRFFGRKEAKDGKRK